MIRKVNPVIPSSTLHPWSLLRHPLVLHANGSSDPSGARLGAAAGCFAALAHSALYGDCRSGCLAILNGYRMIANGYPMITNGCW